MFYILLVILSQLLLGLASFTEKLFAKKSGGYLPNNLLYSAGIAISSLFVYSWMAGFDLKPDGEIIYHALIYGCLYASSMTCLFVAYRRLNMVIYSVFGKSSSILVCIIGITLLGDEPKITTFVSVGLLFISILLPLLEGRKKEGQKSSLFSLIICICAMLIGTGVSLTIKSFSSLESYTPQRASAMYFYANIVTFIFLAVAVLISTRKPKEGSRKSLLGINGIGLRSTFLKVNPYLYILIPIVATVANIPTVINTVCIKNMDLSVYIVLSNAAALATLFFISKVIFKEKSTLIEIIALLISGAAGIISCL